MKTVEFIGGKDIYMCQCVGEHENCQENHSGTYVLASEAQEAVSQANAEWIERCRKWRKQDAGEATERERVLVENFSELILHIDRWVGLSYCHELNKAVEDARAALAQVKEE